jgi:transcriptional regulator with GAF, ATPase, and Fis domain
MKQESSLQTIKQRYGVVGKSEQLDRALDTALQVANTDLSVLIMGESGVGKEVIPRIIHDNSSRKGKKYFAINCRRALSMPNSLDTKRVPLRVR